MKKFSLFLAAFMTFGMLTGCGSQQVPAETTLSTSASTIETTTAPTTAPTQPPKPVVIDFDLTVPEGFTLSVVEEQIQVYSSPNSPRDPSFISVEICPRDEAVLTMSTEKMADRIMHPVTTAPSPSEITQTTEETEPTTPVQSVAEPFIQYLEPADIDDWEAVYADYVQSSDTHTDHVYRYEVVTTDANYVFTFSDGTDDNEWLEEYKKSVESINLILNTEGMELDYSHLTKYTTQSGLSIHAEAGLEPHDAQGFTDAFANKNVLILTMADGKITNNLTGMTLEDYADLVANSNKLEKFQTDMYGNLFTTFYSSDKAGIEYYNMICVKETNDKFWVCQMTCQASNQVNYAKEFPLWASSIS